MTLPVVPAPAPAPGLAPRLAVKLADGRVGDIAESDVPAALAGGARLLSPEQARAAEFEASMGPLDHAAAGVYGAARGILPGADAAYVGLARRLEAAGVGAPGRAEEFRQYLGDLKAADEGISTVAEIGGMLASPLGKLGGGTAGLAGRAGLSGAATVGGRIAQAGLRASIGGAVEGAAFGVGQQIGEDALGDHEHTAEALWAAAQKGALFGGALGGALGAGGQALGDGLAGMRGLAGRAAPAGDGLPALNRLAREVAAEGGEAAGLPSRKGLAGLVDDVKDRLGSQAAGDVKRAADRVYQDAQTLARYDDELDKVTRRVTELDRPILDAEKVTSEAWFGQREAQMARLVDPANRAGQKTAALEFWQEWQSLVEKWRDVKGSGLEGTIKRQAGRLEGFAKELGPTLTKADHAAHPERVFNLINDAKRELADAARFGKDTVGALPDVKMATADFDALYHRARGILEDGSLWGEAAAVAQRDVNAAYTTALATRDRFAQTFLARYGSEAGRPVAVFDPAKIRGHLGRIGDAAEDLNARAMADYAAGLRARFDAVERHAALSPAEKAAIARGRAAVDQMEATFGQARADAEVIGLAKKLKAEEQGAGATALPALLGHLVGGPFGALAAQGAHLVADAFMRPITAAEKLGTMRRVAQKIDDAIGKATAGIVHGAGAAGGATRSLPGRAETLARARALSALAGNPAALVDKLGGVFKGLGDAAPKTTAHLGSVATRAVMFLADKAPRTPSSSPISLTPHLDKPANDNVSDSRVEQWARYLDAVENPLRVLDDMKTGDVSREGVEVLREVYPKLYAQVKVSAFRELSKRSTPLPWEQAKRLAFLLDLPADPTLTPAFVRAMAGTMPTAQQGAPAPAGQGAAPAPQNTSGRKGRPIETRGMRTASERIEAA